MQRPVMNPRIGGDDGFDEPSSEGGVLRWAGELTCAVGRVVGQLLLLDLIPQGMFRLGRTVKEADAGGGGVTELGVTKLSVAGRVARWVISRFAGALAVLLLVVVTMVYAGTRPVETRGTQDPGVLGLYVEHQTVKAVDGQRSVMWVVPVLDASRVLREGEKSLKGKWPVVLLVPDDGAQRSQMLPLVRPLHQAGAIVAVLAPRGRETPEPGAVTFGLNEAADVMAAVALLKGRSDVDSSRICLAGIGSGATAVMLAAEAVGAESLVMVSPAEDAGEVIRERVTPRQRWLGWMTPLCKWAFELGYGVDADDISLVRHSRVMTRPTTRVIPWRGPSNELSPVVAGHTLTFLQHQLKRSETVQMSDD